MNIAILTSPNQWFVSYVEKLNKEIVNSQVFFDHKKMNGNYDVVFILSYHKIIKQEYLSNNKHNIVIHASALPNGKGWAPMFWQILEGKNKIPFTMFEASEDVDDGDIYMQKTLTLSGYELNYKLRKKQAEFIINMCIDFLDNYDDLEISTKQIGKESFYKKRTAKDSELDINKTIQEQFNLLRIVDNNDYPAFFYKDDKKYIIKIEEAN